LTHSVTKSFCFFAAGSTLLAVGSRDISSVRGLIRTSPPAAVALMLGGLAIAGAPPFAVFLSEFSILRAGVGNGQFIPALLLALFIVIAFCGIMYQINRMVFGTPEGPSQRTRLPTSSLIALAISAIPVLVFGLYIPGTLHDMLRLAAASLGR